MTAPPFLRFTLVVDFAHYDQVVSVLIELPLHGWQEEDGGQRFVFWLEEAVGERAEVAEGLARLATIGRLETAVERQDWDRYWRCFHERIRVGRVCVRPPWEPPLPGSLDVVIEVGMAFGTGAHATTRQALSALQTLPPSSLLDLGTGTGVLALAAGRLGFSPLYCCDNDELALRAAAENARRNAIELRLLAVDVTDETRLLPTTEVAVANIALRPIVAYGRRLLRQADTEGPRHLLLAGLLAGQADEARAAFPGYEERAHSLEGERVLLHLGRAV